MSRPRRLLRRAGDLCLTLGALVGVVCLVATIAAVGFGVKPLIFRSGSMSPAIPAGSLGFARHVSADDIAVGQVVSVPWRDSRVTHRVVRVTHRPGGVTLQLKGDANNAPDQQLYDVSSADRLWFSVPWAGTAVAWLSRPPGVFVLAAYVALLLAIILRRGDGGSEQGGGEHGAGERRTGDRRMGGRHAADGTAAVDSSRTERGPRPGAGRRHRQALGVGSVVLVLGAVTATPTWAAWNDQTTVAGVSIGTGSLNPPTNMTCSGGGLLTSPTLSWTAPTGGVTPNQYTVTYRSGSATATPTTATTTSTSWQMPNGILDVLATYYVSVQSSLAGTNWVSAAANPGQKVTITSVLGVGAVTSCSGTFTPTS